MRSFFKADVPAGISHPDCLVKMFPVSVELLKLGPVARTGADQSFHGCDVGFTVLQVLLDHLRTPQVTSEHAGTDNTTLLLL